MSQVYALAHAYVHSVTGYDPALTVCDFRMVHDQDKGAPGINLRGILSQLWEEICRINDMGYGAFFVTQTSDGNGVGLPNITTLRTHFIDLDDTNTASQNYHAADGWMPAPAFAVYSSPGKAHVYWPCEPYCDRDRFSLIQRKLAAMFQADPRICDAARIMRLPGTLHAKGERKLVTCHAMRGYGFRTSPEVLENALSGIQVSDGSGSRHELGDPELAAPGPGWAEWALLQADPNNLDRAEWISVTSAFKQAAWSYNTPEQTFDIWSQWCSRYAHNDVAENLKQFNSIRNTEVGWKKLVHSSPTAMAYVRLGMPTQARAVQQPQAIPTPPGAPVAAIPVPAMPTPPVGEMLTSEMQREYFQKCFFIERFGTILTPSKRQMSPQQFNGRYGGKKFIIDSQGNVTDEAWRAALRSTIWTIPKVDHIRFMPQLAPFDIVTDALGRQGVNTYSPAIIVSQPGDVTTFIRHLEMLMPDRGDRDIYLSYLAHNVQYPGYKIPWAPLLQSAEGAGKGMFKLIMKHAMGDPYVYFPKAPELASTGAKFNSWMREKLLILVDEIKVDDRRDLIEVLKPMISEAEIEIEGKGQNQDKEDNYSNWLFFSNYKDAIPINENGRRYAIFYLAIQSKKDLTKLGLDEAYFAHLYDWLSFGGGKEAVTHFLQCYPIQRGGIPMRAPLTSSTREALEQSRGPLDQLLQDLIADGKQGFRGEWASTIAFRKAARLAGVNVRSNTTLGNVLQDAGFHKIGRAPREFAQEELGHRSTLYHRNEAANSGNFGHAQGYE